MPTTFTSEEQWQYKWDRMVCIVKGPIGKSMDTIIITQPVHIIISATCSVSEFVPSISTLVTCASLVPRLPALCRSASGFFRRTIYMQHTSDGKLGGAWERGYFCHLPKQKSRVLALANHRLISHSTQFRVQSTGVIKLQVSFAVVITALQQPPTSSDKQPTVGEYRLFALQVSSHNFQAIASYFCCSCSLRHILFTEGKVK